LKRSKELECAENWRTGLSGVPPDSVRCTRIVHSEPATLGNSRAPSAIIHRTVRCVSGQQLSSANGRLYKVLQWDTMPRQKSEQQSHRAPDCPVPQEDKAPTIDRAPNPNGWVMWRLTGQRTVHVRWCTKLSGAPIAGSLPNGYQSGWGL
jgi:hypothetical protein